MPQYGESGRGAGMHLRAGVQPGIRAGSKHKNSFIQGYMLKYGESAYGARG